MSETFSRLKQSLIPALKSGDKTKAGVLRMLLSSVHTLAISKQIKDEDITEDDIISLLNKEAKARLEAATAFRSASRDTLADQEEMELAIIKEYLPEPATEEEIKSIIIEAISETEDNNFGSIMKAVTTRLKGRADGVIVSRLVKEHLSQ